MSFPGKLKSLMIPHGTRRKYVENLIFGTFRFFRKTVDAPVPDQYLKADRTPGKNILFVDDIIPDPSQGKGYPRTCEILRILSKEGYRISFFPGVSQASNRRTVELYREMGIELFFRTRGFDHHILGSILSQRRNWFDTVIISRPHNMRHYFDMIMRSQKNARLIYDAEALYCMRQILYREVIKKKTISESLKERLIRKEIELAKKADHVITVSENEGSIFKKYGVSDVSIVSHSLQANPTAVDFDQRKGILFVGSIGSRRNPNEDAVLNFVNGAYPLIRNEIPGIKLYIVGPNESARVNALNSEQIIVTGRIDDITDYYNKCRVFIAPSRFAAGIPLKVCEAAAHGIPSVVAPLLQEQLGWKTEEELLTADTPQEFARQCVRLHTDSNLWKRVRQNGLKKVTEFCNRDNFRNSLKDAMK